MTDVTENSIALQLLVLWIRRWKFIAAFVIIPTVAAGFLAYFGEKTYTARMTVVMVKNQKTAASSILSSLGMGDVSALVGGGNTDVNTILTLSGTRKLSDVAIARFRLDTVWKLGPKWKPEDGYKFWSRSLKMTSSEIGDDVLELEYVDHDPKRATEIVVFVEHWIDSAFIGMGMARSNRSLQFIQSRMEKKQLQMDTAEKALRGFLLREKLFVPDQRIALGVRRMAELEANVDALGIQSEMLEITHGRQSSARNAIEDQRRLLKDQIAKLENSSQETWAGASLSKDLERRFVYEHLMRNLERHATVFKYLVQQEEMLQIDSRKDLPVLTILDPAKVPQKKTAPKVLLIIQMVFCMSLSLSLVLVTLEKHIKHYVSVLWAEFRRN